MSYKCVIILLCIVPVFYAYTDITMLNCPAQFNIEQYNITTDTTVASMGPMIYAGFSSSSSQDRVNEIVINGDT